MESNEARIPFRRAKVSLKYLPVCCPVKVPLRVELSGACRFSERPRCPTLVPAAAESRGTAVALVTLTKKPLQGPLALNPTPSPVRH